MCDIRLLFVAALAGVTGVSGCILSVDTSAQSGDTSWQLGTDGGDAARDTGSETDSRPDDSGAPRDTDTRDILNDTRDIISCDSDSASLPERCRCNYRQKPKGVCRNQRVGETGCLRPQNYEDRETSCEDDLDNDCDGQTDTNDPDCQLAPGKSCSKDSECKSGVCCNSDVCKNRNGGRVCSYRIFVTTETTDGKIGGLAGGDTMCSQAAKEASLGGTWKAVLSTESMPASAHLKTQPGVPIVNVHGNEVVRADGGIWNEGRCDNCGDLLTENGAIPSPRVWTGTFKAGGFGNDACNGWTSNSPDSDGAFGNPSRSDSGWMDVGGTERTCDNQLALYCIDGQ